MEKINLLYVTLIVLAMSVFYSCEKPQTPQVNPEEEISIDFLKNRKPLLEIYVYNSGVDTTSYVYDVKRRLERKRVVRYMNQTLDGVHEELYSYDGLNVTVTYHEQNYGGGILRSDTTYIFYTRVYTDTTYTKVKSESRALDNYLCNYEYDSFGRIISCDELYVGKDYSYNQCNFHTVASYIYSGKECTWKVDTYKDNVLYEIYEGIDSYADVECKYKLSSNREYTKYPPKEDYASETRYYSRKLKTEQSYTYDEFYRMTSNISKRYTVSGSSDKLEDRYSYVGKKGHVEHYVDDKLISKTEITYIDL